MKSYGVHEGFICDCSLYGLHFLLFNGATREHCTRAGFRREPFFKSSSNSEPVGVFTLLLPTGGRHRIASSGRMPLLDAFKLVQVGWTRTNDQRIKAPLLYH